MLGHLWSSSGSTGAEVSLGVVCSSPEALVVEGVCKQRLPTAAGSPQWARSRWALSLDGQGTTLAPVGHFSSAGKHRCSGVAALGFCGLEHCRLWATCRMQGSSSVALQEFWSLYWRQAVIPSFGGTTAAGQDVFRQFQQGTADRPAGLGQSQLLFSLLSQLFNVLRRSSGSAVLVPVAPLNTEFRGV